MGARPASGAQTKGASGVVVLEVSGACFRRRVSVRWEEEVGTAEGVSRGGAPRAGVQDRGGGDPGPGVSGPRRGRPRGGGFGTAEGASPGRVSGPRSGGPRGGGVGTAEGASPRPAPREEGGETGSAPGKSLKAPPHRARTCGVRNPLDVRVSPSGSKPG